MLVKKRIEFSPTYIAARYYIDKIVIRQSRFPDEAVRKVEQRSTIYYIKFEDRIVADQSYYLSGFLHGRNEIDRIYYFKMSGTNGRAFRNYMINDRFVKYLFL